MALTALVVYISRGLQLNSGLCLYDAFLSTGRNSVLSSRLNYHYLAGQDPPVVMRFGTTLAHAAESSQVCL